MGHASLAILMPSMLAGDCDEFTLSLGQPYFGASTAMRQRSAVVSPRRWLYLIFNTILML